MEEHEALEAQPQQKREAHRVGTLHPPRAVNTHHARNTLRTNAGISPFSR